MSTDVSWYRVGSPYPTFQAAVDAALTAGGGVVYVPSAGVPSLFTTLQIPATPNPERALIIRGDGAGVSKLSRLNATSDIVNVQRSKVIFEGLTIEPPGGSAIFGNGITVGGGSSAVRDVTIRDCIIRGTAAQAIRMSGPLSNVTVERCVLAANTINAGPLVRVGPTCRNIAFSDCAFDFFKGSAVELEGCDGVSFYDGNCESAADTGPAPFVSAVNATNCHFTNLWFEEASNAQSGKWFMDLGAGCHGWTIVGCYFVRKRDANPDGALKLIRLGRCGGVPAGPVLGAMILNPVALRAYTSIAEIPLTPGAIEIADSASEVCVIGGLVSSKRRDTVSTPYLATTYHPLDIVDPTSKSTWIGPNSWRPPFVGLSETLNSTGRLGDMLARPGRGLEMWNARGAESRWLPASVNRYPNEDALSEFPDRSREKGTVVWIDTPPASTSNLRVWDGTTWRGVVYS